MPHQNPPSTCCKQQYSCSRSNSREKLWGITGVRYCRRPVTGRLVSASRSEDCGPPVFVNLKLHHPTQQKTKRKFRCMKHFDPNTSLTDLSHNLNNINPEAGEVNTLSHKFVKVLNDTLDKHAPYRYASSKEQRSFNEPWLTKGILTSIAKKNTLYRKQLTTNNPNILRQCKTYRNKLPHLKEISKQNYCKPASQKCHHDIKHMAACQ